MGGVVGGVSLALLVVVACVCRARRSRSNNNHSPSSASIYGPIAPIANNYNEPGDVRRNYAPASAETESVYEDVSDVREAKLVSP